MILVTAISIRIIFKMTDHILGPNTDLTFSFIRLDSHRMKSCEKKNINTKYIDAIADLAPDI
jgi:hypothetical protein